MALDDLPEVLIIKKLAKELFLMVLLKHLQSFFTFLYRLAPLFILFGSIKATFSSLFNFLLLSLSPPPPLFSVYLDNPGFVKEIFLL